MTFAEELAALLPEGLPNRTACLEGAARHLDLIVEVNQQFNLTRIVSPREAAIKHVLDSVLPWTLFASVNHIADAGSGAGFPGIPLAFVLPETRITLIESTQKRARFLETAVSALGLTNVDVVAERAEDWLKHHSAEVITARAVAPLDRALPLFGPALRKGMRLLLYKGPDAGSEIAAASTEIARERCDVRIVSEYQLPDGLGSRTIVEAARRSR